jgi:NAD+ kinase
MRLALYSRVYKDEYLPVLVELFAIIKEKGIQIAIFEPIAATIQEKLNLSIPFSTYDDYSTLPDNIDFLIALGGDGTLLDTVRLVRGRQIPVAGINAGRLGFLADINKQEVKELIFSLENNTYSIEKRTLVHVDSNLPIFDVNFGLNEFAIHKTESSSMISILVYLNGEYLNSYWADGLIIATPTGSTAYSLSCGGPIVFPTTKSFVLTPVAPHNLNARPMVIPDDTVLSFDIQSRSEHFLCTLDSNYQRVDKSCQLAVRKADFTFNLVRMPESHYLKTLRQKIKWGEDLRN